MSLPCNTCNNTGRYKVVRKKYVYQEFCDCILGILRKGVDDLERDLERLQDTLEGRLDALENALFNLEI